MSNPWIRAVRLRTLPLAWASLTMGAILAIRLDSFDWKIYLLSIATAFALQILSNLANDYGDAVSGLDGDDRVGPKRTIQEGLITKAQMKRAIVFTCVLSFILGSWLVYSAFQDMRLIAGFLILGILAIIAALRYTMGSNPYGYAGWGDFFVLVFFGWVGVSGSLMLFSGEFILESLLPASTIGLMAVAVLNINNIRDIESDKLSGKFSIPVKIGRNRAVAYHGVLLTMSVFLMVLYALISEFQSVEWLFLLVIPMLIINWRGVKKNTEATKIDPYLKQMALSTLLFVILFLVGVLVSA